MPEDMMELFEEVQEELDEEMEDIPEMSDPGWTEYVLSLLTEEEKVNGKPKALGLLRIAPVVLGKNIHQNDPDVHAVSEEYAAVTMRVQFDDGTVFAGSAEVSGTNCGEPYSRYPLGSASTRALGRALKTAMCLQVLTAEEGNDMAVGSNEQIEGSTLISETQIQFIDIYCGTGRGKLNINVQDAVSSIMGYEVESIGKLTHDDALAIQETLDKWAKDKDLIPDGVGEYDSGWRSSFA